MASKILFIEGAPASEANGNLQQGFEKLLKQKLGRNMPRMIMGGGKGKTVDKFLNNRFEQRPYLLVDLDKPEETKKDDLKAYSLEAHTDNVFFMIQEMESWFISQPDVLNHFFGIKNKGSKVSEKIPQKPANAFSNPKEELCKFTKDSRRGPYQIVKHAIDLLAGLDATQLARDFPDFDNLIKALT